MSARRCSTCAINYPVTPSGYEVCPACGGKTSWFQNVSPDKDWKEQVVAAQKPEPEYVDPVVSWRRTQLEEAGYGPLSVLELASRRDVDLRRAVELAERAGPELAARILI